MTGRSSVMSVARELKLVFPPGQSFAYSNGNYDTLGVDRAGRVRPVV